MNTNKISLLYPIGSEIEFKEVTPETIHDLGMDMIIKKLSTKELEQNLILGIMSKMTKDPAVAKYRIDVFDDIYKNPSMREELMEILDRISFLKDYGSFSRKYNDGPSVWDLMHRLEEINDYIICIEALQKILADTPICSQGLLDLKSYIQCLYDEQAFAELKKDVAECKASTKDLRSVTVGINLNDKFEASEIGVISINNKSFSKANIISNFYDKLSLSDSITDGSEWNENYKFQPFSVGSDVIGRVEKLGRMNMIMAHPLLSSSLASVPEKDSTENITYYMNSITNHMLSLTTKKIRGILSQYINITVSDITNLIPEFIYYIRWAEYIEGLQAAGSTFSKAVAISDESRAMDAREVYNIKLAATPTKDHEVIITNDLKFTDENRVFILTGANRGGKTTITQCIGQLFVLAQGGIYIPGSGFSFSPVDNVFTHFPADEDKTMDLGRLGEECKRFKELFTAATKDSLLLLNETFSTTSFEEGYFIAKDSVKAILNKGIRTIYNTHMHKLAFDINSLNEGETDGKAASLVVQSKDGQRSYKVMLAMPEGQSLAWDIAKKYGVTYDMLVNNN